MHEAGILGFAADTRPQIWYMIVARLLNRHSGGNKENMKRLVLFLWLLPGLAARAAEATASFHMLTTVDRAGQTNQPYSGAYFSDAQIFSLQSNSLKTRAAERIGLNPVAMDIQAVAARFDRATSVMTITVTGTDPHHTADLANAILDTYLEHLEPALTNPALKILTAQSDEIQKRLEKNPARAGNTESEKLNAIYSLINERITDRQNGIESYHTTIDACEKAAAP